MKVKRKEVWFYRAGSLFDEQDIVKTDELSISWALSNIVKKRRSCFGFRLVTVYTNGDKQVSGMYHVDSKVETLAQIEARNDEKDEILISNMRTNGIKAVVTTLRGWKHTTTFGVNDALVFTEEFLNNVEQ